ncbi:hypothetical protein [Microbulbifer yueqingensis]|uniref:Uncharacterized protein n=1 Tax=Microbulbifer yueqingensis TaxID=658219 RepID=A0A1G8ZE56_9GAMM|nr:hypothetical protein [Microbulbifer yueqingensis]SDK13406.1 hypothetical protein SAMN05216212_1587 [Microbulbifer yueqingensis]
MSAQLFQVVSAGKTLRDKPPAEVLEAAAKAFSIPVPRARPLLVKGWVIKDGLSSQQVVEYRSRLQRIGLRVEVFPAGKYNNKALLARMEYARKRRAGGALNAPAATGQAEDTARAGIQKKPVPAASPAAVTAASARPIKGAASSPPSSRARQQLEALFAGGDNRVPDPLSARTGLLLGLPGVALVPAFFVLLLALCVYSAGSAAWRFGEAILVAQAGPGAVVGLVASLTLSGLVAALLVWPFFSARRLAADAQPVTRALSRAEGQGLYLLLDVLADKLALPRVSGIRIAAGSTVRVDSEGLAESLQQSPVLVLGLGAAYSLSGNELLALVARQLGTHRGRIRALAAWLALETPRRLQWLQWALENDRTVLSHGSSRSVQRGGAPAALKPLHKLLALCGRGVIPILDRLEALHQVVGGPVARLLVREADRCAAQVIGSDAFAPFAEKWQQLVHADLLVSEVNREAAIAGQRLENYPRAIVWTMRNLDRETVSNLELAMAQPSDYWDSTSPADNDRVALVEDLGLAPAVGNEFSVHKLVEDLHGLAAEASASVSAEDTRPVDNQQLLCVTEDAERALQVMGEYFNRIPPRRFLPADVPGDQTLAAMGLQECVDWLRNKLVELRELTRNLDELSSRATMVELGAELMRQAVKVPPGDFRLEVADAAAADATLRDLRARRDAALRQYHQIQGVFVLRMKRAIGSMGSDDRTWAQAALGETQAFDSLAPHVDKLDEFAMILGYAMDRLSLEPAQREVLQKFYDLAQRALDAVSQQVQGNEVLVNIGLESALQARLAGSMANRQVEPLPRERQALVDRLQEMELCCKTASATVSDQYRKHLARLLQQCLETEKSLGVKPLRLVGELS